MHTNIYTQYIPKNAAQHTPDNRLKLIHKKQKKKNTNKYTQVGTHTNLFRKHKVTSKKKHTQAQILSEKQECTDRQIENITQD